LTSPVVGGDGGRQRLTAATDKGGRWRLTVAMDGSCGSGGRYRWWSMAAVAVVFEGGSSVQRRSMASAMDYNKRMRGWRKDRQHNNQPAR